MTRTLITIVHATGCHFCGDAERAIAELATEYTLDTQLVDATSTHGRALVDRHRAPMFPLVLVDGEFFSFGRLSSKKLRKLLDTKITVGVA